ncbi:ATP-dependent DNA helicase RRM3 [Lachancea thermotolerans]
MFSQRSKRTKSSHDSSKTGPKSHISSSDAPTMRQKTVTSFFAKKTRRLVGTSSLAAEPHKSVLMGRKPLFESQGSFDEENRDEELKHMLNEKPLNNFKSLSRSSSSLSTSSGQVTATQASLTSFGSSQHFVKYSPFSSSFTEGLDGGMVSSTQRAPEKRPPPSHFSFSLNKKIKSSRAGPSTSQSLTKASGNNPQLDLTKEQRQVIDLIVSQRKNVFYTGSAGTGKSVVLRELVRQLRARYGDAAVAVTASTGLAAVNIGGMTVNRFSGINIGIGSVQKLAAQVKRNKTNSERWKRTSVLIIDEVSMIDGRFLDKMDFVARDVRRVHDKPFGGIQLVMTGDFFQLPPVADRDRSVPKPPFCFESKVWRQAIDKTICLTQVFRQKDQELVDLLNSIRFGVINTKVAQQIRSFEREVNYSDGIMPTELYPTRREVEMSNKRMLDRLPGDVKVFHAQDQATSDNPYLLKILDSLMVEKNIALKEDAQVMMIKNMDETLVNGSVGKLLFFTTELLHQKMLELFPATKLSDPDLVLDMRLVSRCIGVASQNYPPDIKAAINQRPLQRTEQLSLLLKVAEREDKGLAFPFIRFTTPSNGFRYELILPAEFTIDVPAQKTSVSRTQLPLILCWALSIHKAQGQTIDRLKVDLKKVFEEGQVYVALSRAVSKERLQIVNFDPRVIKANEKVKSFYQTLEVL